MATDMDTKVSISERKCSKFEHVSPEMSVDQLMFVVIVARSVHQKVLLANQYIVTFVDTGFMLLMRVLTRSNSSYSTSLVNQLTILSINIVVRVSVRSCSLIQTDNISTVKWLLHRYR